MIEYCAILFGAKIYDGNFQFALQNSKIIWSFNFTKIFVAIALISPPFFTILCRQYRRAFYDSIAKTYVVCK